MSSMPLMRRSKESRARLSIILFARRANCSPSRDSISDIRRARVSSWLPADGRPQLDARNHAALRVLAQGKEYAHEAEGPHPRPGDKVLEMGYLTIRARSTS